LPGAHTRSPMRSRSRGRRPGDSSRLSAQKRARARFSASSRKRRRLRQGASPGSRPSPGICQAGLFQLLPIFSRHTPSDFVPAWQQICIARDQSKLSNFCKLYCNKVVAKNFAQMCSIWQLACYN
jgi:hypothetical protein